MIASTTRSVSGRTAEPTPPKQPLRLRRPDRPTSRRRASFTFTFAISALAPLLAGQGCHQAGLYGASDAVQPEQYVHLPPLVWWTREPDGNREVRNFLGFLYHHSQEDRNRRKVVHFMWPLGMYSAQSMPGGRTERRFRALPFAWMTKRSEPSGAGYDFYQIRASVLGPVFSLRADNYGEGYVNAHILWPFGQYFRGEKRVGADLRKFHLFRLIPFVHIERNWRPGRRGGARSAGAGPHHQRYAPTAGAGADAAEEEIRLDERGTFRFLHFLMGLEREVDEGVSRIYLVGGTARSPKTGRKTMAALWGSERGPSTDREHQLFWRFFVLRRAGARDIAREHARPGAPRGADTGERPSDRWRLVRWMFHGSPRVTASVGPVLTYESDWEADTKRVSVLAGLYSYERVGLRRTARLFWGLFRFSR